MCRFRGILSTSPDTSFTSYLIEMRPKLLQLGGVDQFSAYKRAFHQLYCEHTVMDVFGNEVQFGEDECTQVCFGGVRPLKWTQERAERIGWIGEALTNPKKIHPDKDYPKRQKYLLYLSAVPGTDQENEYYCVIVEIKNRAQVAFITAYNISQLTYRAYCNVSPCLYPPKKIKPMKGKKKG